jgi:succinate dehydrogenase flavin-adding protein (antitoxin of CptAB toxin-antitoxin module)
MKSCPATPPELVTALTEIFPAFVVCREADEGEVETYHSVFLFDFNPYFAKHAPEFTEKQLKTFSRLLTKCLDDQGSLRNAVETGFLEHLHQMEVARYVRPYLKAAREELAQ